MLNRTVALLFSMFLLFNFVVRLSALHSHGIILKVLLALLVAIFVVARGRPDFIKGFFLLLGLSLPLYGFQSYSFYNSVFEFLIVFLACLLLFTKGNMRRIFSNTGVVVGFMGGYLLLVLFSLLVLPLSAFSDNLTLWGLFDFCNAFFSATPDDPLYSVAAVNRLLLFIVFILLINNNSMVDKLYRMVFFGCAGSVLIACLLGLLNQYEIISLAWYRPVFRDAAGVARLHSVFGNPGWFAEYILVCTPFVLLLFCKKTGGKLRGFIFFSIFVLIGASLLLTGSRTSWLIFPLVAFSCWAIFLLFYMDKGGAISWKELKRRCLQVSGGVLVFCLLVASGLAVTGRDSFTENPGESLTREQYIYQRIRDITNPSVRSKLWQESLVLVSESPLFGMGYESYRWHQEVMSSIPASRFSQQRQTDNNWDTAHNFYIQLVAGNGIAGLLVWLLLTAYVAFLLCRDAFTNRNVQSFALLGSLVSFHLYGFTQSMQYIASIYFLVFLVIGYAMRLESKRKLRAMTRTGKYGAVAALLVAVSGGVVYSTNLQSHKLAERYGLPHYGIERQDTQYKGFYKKEDWGKDGFFRWSGRAAEIVLRGSGAVQFHFSCYAPRLEQLPLTFDVMLDGRAIDQYTFRKGEKITRTYFLPVRARQSPVTLHLQLSRVWNPKREKVNNDTRNLGIAVSEPRYITMLPVIPALLLQ
ncbi:MAG: O-antigen ligase family protein [Thermodesulfobacteriota bacterium]|nr:O-antigen ligase family protein [Thermodesulfobacteriota bacterium]